MGTSVEEAEARESEAKDSLRERSTACNFFEPAYMAGDSPEPLLSNEETYLETVRGLYRQPPRKDTS